MFDYAPSPDWISVLKNKHVYSAVGGTMAATHADHDGEKFVTLTSGGPKAEGSMLPHDATFKTETEAWVAFSSRLSVFAYGKSVVFFRMLPVLETVPTLTEEQARWYTPLHNEGQFYVICRLSAH